MLIKVDGDNVEVVREVEHKKPAVCEAADRIKDELQGFLMYQEMEKARKHKDPEAKPRYNVVSMQELTHMFLALNDFFADLIPLLNEDELAEFKRWKTSLEG